MLPFKYFHYLKKLNHDVYLLTHARTKSNFEDLENIFFIPDTKAHIFLHKLGQYLPERIAVITTGVISHYVTQIYQWIYARKVIKAKNIDIIHEPAPVSPKQPSVMFGLGVPVIIGPMNGGMDFPRAFKHMAGKFEGVFQYFVRFISHFFNLLIPGKLFAARLLVANKRTEAALPCFRLGRVELIVENSADQISSGTRTLADKKEGGVTRVLFVGRLIDLKVIDILIDSFREIDDPAIHFDVVGDGPERAKLEAQAEELKNVTFHGWVEHAEINTFYDQADIFVIPSVRECGGAVVLEAMASGLPCIVTDWGGPVDYIAEGTGLLVSPVSRDQMVKEFKQHIEYLVNNPEKRIEMGIKAKAHIAENFLWESKVKRMIDVYREVIAE